MRLNINDAADYINTTIAAHNMHISNDIDDDGKPQ